PIFPPLEKRNRYYHSLLVRYVPLPVFSGKATESYPISIVQFPKCHFFIPRGSAAIPPGNSFGNGRGDGSITRQNRSSGIGYQDTGFSKNRVVHQVFAGFSGA